MIINKNIFFIFYPQEVALSAQQRTKLVSMIRFRTVLVGVALLMCFIYIAQRIITLGVQEQFTHLSPHSLIKNDSHHQLGKIFDRNGILVASNITTYQLLLDTRKINQEPDKYFDVLHHIIPDLKRKPFIDNVKRLKGWYVVHHHLTPQQRQEIYNQGIVGIDFKKNTKRFYPHNHLNAHFVGHISKDTHETKTFSSGIEKAMYDDIHQGRDVHLTLDIRMQHVVHKALAETLYHYKAKAGSAILVSLKNMEVLSMVSLPDYNINAYEDNTQWLNRAIQGGFEPGSTLKILNTAIALEQKTASLHSLYDATKPLYHGRYRITDYHPKNRFLNVPEIFIYSSNIGSAKMALDIEAETHKKYIDHLYLNRKLDIILSDHDSAKAPENWSDIYRITFSYGHGVQVTPLHLVTALAPILYDGVVRMPQFLKVSEDRASSDNKTIFSSSTIESMRRLMRLNVTNGSGVKANIEGMLVGGKTGTTEKSTQDSKAIISSFLGVFPAHDPQYMMYVMVDEPQEINKNIRPTGGVVAAPLVGKIIEHIKGFLPNYPVKNSKDIDKILAIALPKEQMMNVGL